MEKSPISERSFDDVFVFKKVIERSIDCGARSPLSELVIEDVLRSDDLLFFRDAVDYI